MMTRMKLSSMSDLPIITVQEREDGSFVLEWDENDPRCQEFTNWTEEEWNEAFKNGLAKF